jgi:hypothetical protein
MFEVLRATRATNFHFHIVGAGRGGTSLLSGLLDYHTQLEVGFEEFAVACLMGKGLSNVQGAELFNQRVTSYINGCNQLAAKSSHLTWGNKITTEQIYGLEEHNDRNPYGMINVLDELFNKFFGKQKIVFILRDGRTCINSKVNRTGQSFEDACRRWQYSVRCYRFFVEKHSMNICIKYEDLLYEPKFTLGRICAFLDIPYQETMLAGVNNSKIPSEYRTKNIDLSKLLSISLPQHIAEKIHSDMQYCGYL